MNKNPRLLPRKLSKGFHKRESDAFFIQSGSKIEWRVVLVPVIAVANYATYADKFSDSTNNARYYNVPGSFIHLFQIPVIRAVNNAYCII